MDNLDAIMDQVPQAGSLTAILVLLVKFGWPFVRTLLSDRQLKLMKTIGHKMVNLARNAGKRDKALTGGQLEDMAVKLWRKHAPKWLRKLDEDVIVDIVRDCYEEQEANIDKAAKIIEESMGKAAREMEEAIKRMHATIDASKAGK